jgi:Flp pilus assembly protein TadG
MRVGNTPVHDAGERWDAERGSGGASLAWLIVMPAALLLVFGGIQFGVRSYAANLALAAAQTGVRAATASPASAERGQSAAEAYLANAAAGSLHGGAVTVTVTAGNVTVVVTGTSQSLVPGMTFTVTGRAAGPLEPEPGP